MRIGILGGTFDPPHRGHLGVAQIVMASGLVDRILFVPCLRHAFGKKPADFLHRLEMCRRLICGEPHLEVSDIEAQLNKPGRTLDLLEALSGVYPQGVFRLIAGTDIYLERKKWYRFDLVEKMAPPIYVERRGQSTIPVPTLDAPPQISSSFIREALKGNESVSELLTKEVSNYILENGLYKEG